MKLFCTIEDIKSLRPIAKGIDADRVNPFIIEAMENDVAPLLGNPLYSDMMLKIDNSIDAMFENYNALLRGEIYYTPTGSVHAELFRGVWLSVAYYSLARFIESQKMNITRFGVVEKLNQESQATSIGDIQSVVTTLRSNAINNDREVIKYLNSNSATYIKWIGNQSSEKTGVKWFDL